jgi:large subunit ribosomal protein L25
MEKITLAAAPRHETGKGPSRRLRAKGQIPAVFYGKKSEPIKIAVDLHDFTKSLERAGSNPLFDLRIGDDTRPNRTALLKERQVNPFKGVLVHLDFLEVFMDEAIEVTVPLEFTGKPSGLDQGGAFQITVRDLKISCLPDSIPEVIEVDVSGLTIGHSVHVRDVSLPPGVQVALEGSLALATVLAPKRADEATPAEVPEGGAGS